MNHRLLAVAAVVPALVGLAIGGCAGTSQEAEPWTPPAEPRMTNLMQAPLDPRFTPDREVILTLVELPPNATLERHWHPGEEFHYYLEGDAEIQIEGQEPIIGTPGTFGHVPLHALHSATAGDRGAKVIVFRVHTAGEPVRHPPEHPRPQ